MKLFVAIYDDCALLPHFVNHYNRLGIEQYYIAADRSVAEVVRDRVQQVNAVVRDDLDVLDSFQGGAKAVTQMRLEYSGDSEWVLITDLDEFATLDCSLDSATSFAEAEDANVVRGHMLDRVAADGSMPAITDDMDVWTVFPRKCRLTSRLQGSVDHKGVLVRGHLAPSMAHHEFANERLSSLEVQVHHFKWNANAEARTRIAMNLARAAGINWWSEYERVLSHLNQHGRIRWEDYEIPE